jgi:hypothetical protein
MSTTVQELEKEVGSVPERAKAFTITTNEDFERAGELLKIIKGLRAEVDSTFDGIISKAHEAHKEAIAQKRKYEAPLAEAERLLKPKLSAYLDEQERQRKAEELRLEAEARAEAERQQLENAVVLDDMGETEAANALLSERVQSAPVFVPKQAPKVAGIVPTKTYSAQVVNLMDLIKAVADGRVPAMAIQANTVFLGQQARSMKDTFNYPGVKLIVTGGISAAKK